MRALLLIVALAACHNHDDHSERDRKRTETVTHDTPVVTPVVEPDKVDDTTVYKVPIGSSPALGKKTALVTIVEFGDFQCTYCARTEPTLATMRAKYGDDLRIVWKNQPLKNHTRAKPAAELAMDAADQKKDFWAVHDDLFAAQSNLDDATLARIAANHGVKQTTAHHPSIDDDQALASSFGIDATPVFFVNGRKIVGAQSADHFQKVIDSELAFARAYVANKGNTRETFYDSIMASAH